MSCRKTAKFFLVTDENLGTIYTLYPLWQQNCTAGIWSQGCNFQFSNSHSSENFKYLIKIFVAVLFLKLSLTV